MFYKRLFLSAITALVFLTNSVFSQCWPRADKFAAEKSPNNNEQFGIAVDYDNDIAVVGAPNSDTLKLHSGVVYVFQRSGTSWNKIATLKAADYQDYGNFGTIVKIKGDFIYVGDPYHTESGRRKGQIYIFKKPPDGWHDMSETSTLSVADSDVNAFGSSLDFYEDIMIVGAPGTDYLTGNQNGAAFIFQQSGDAWNRLARLSSSYTGGSTFGSHVAIKKNIAVVVADQELHTYVVKGASFVFVKDNSTSWSDALPVARLTSSSTDQSSINYLGYGLAIDEQRETVFIGENIWNNNITEYRKGFRSYVKPTNGWSDMTESAFYMTSENSYVYYQSLQFEEPYLYFTGGNSVDIFKPDNANSWSALTRVSSVTNSKYVLGERFGSALKVSAGRVLVGASGLVTLERNDFFTPSFTKVYEFDMPVGGWQNATYTESNQFTFMPATTADFAYGHAVDIDGDVAVVGAPQDNHDGRNAGMAYVYQRDGLTWKRVAKLYPSNGEPYSNFGWSVAISGDYIAIGAPYANYRSESGALVNAEQGTVYVYKKPAGGWANSTESYKILKVEASNPTDRINNNFGIQVDMDFPYLIVSRFDTGSRPNTGSVFVYNLTGDQPALEATLNPSVRDNINNFGSALKIVNNTIVVGAPTVMGWFIDDNKVFVYTKNGTRWTDSYESAILFPSDFGTTGFSKGITFGFGIDMTESGSTIIVGAPGWHDADLVFNGDWTKFFQGAAYIFEKPSGGWKNSISETARLIVPGQPYFGCMGVSVHIEDRYAVVGSPQNYIYIDQGNPGPGRAYFYQKPDDGWKYKLPDKTLKGDAVSDTDYFGAAVDGVFGYLMIGARGDDIQQSIDAGAVYLYTEYPFIFPGQSPLCDNQPPIHLSAYPTGGQWSGGGFKNATEGLFDPSFAGKGTYTVKYKVDDCDASNALLIEVLRGARPFSLASKDSVFFCGSPDMTFTAPTDVSFKYNWSFTKTGLNYSPIDNSDIPSLKAVSEGFYKVEVYNSCSSQSDSVWVGNLYPDAGAGFTICDYASPRLLHGNYSKGVWSGDGITASGIFSPGQTSVGNHVLNYSVSPQTGCVYKDTIVARVRGIKVTLSPVFDSIAFCRNSPVKVDAQPVVGANFFWTRDDGSGHLQVLNETQNSFSEEISQSGKYILRAVSEDGCEYKSPVMTAHQVQADSLFVPNVITPNGDNSNDVLKIYASEGVESYSLVMVNRYGEEVFKYAGADRSTGWSGGDLSSGVYFLVLTHFDKCDNRSRTYRGTLTIVR